MNYHPRNNFNLKRRSDRNQSRKPLFIGGVFIVAAILFSLFDNVLLTLVSPLWRAENGFSRNISKTFDYFRIKSNLANENTVLKEKITSLEAQVVDLREKNDEVDNLQILLGRKIDKEAVSATVLTRPPQSPYDLVIVDAGLRDGVTVGSKVDLPEGPELGFVFEVFSTFSKVKLFSTSGLKTDAVLEREEVPITLEGAGAGNFKIIIPRETEVLVGDRVLSAALDGRLLAVVEDIKESPTDAFKEISARSPANIFSLRYVSILK